MDIRVSKACSKRSGQGTSVNKEYPLRDGLHLEDARPLLRASLIVKVKIYSLLVGLMQVTRLRFRHKTCGRKEQVCVPFTQSRTLLVFDWLGDMTFKLKRCYRTFEFKSHVGYSRTLCGILGAGLSGVGTNARIF